MPPAGDIAGYGGAYFAPPVADELAPAHPDTSYTCAIDKQGNVFSATPSDVSFEGPVIPGLGICPSSRGSQSFAMSGHASAVAPGKRPRLTPNPALAIAPGRFAMPFGAPGGDIQPQGMLQVFLNHVVFGMDIQHAIDAPRFATHSHPNSFEPHESFPGRLAIEGRVAPEIREDLKEKGHAVDVLPDISIGVAGVCALRADLENGLLSGGADPRRSGRVIGW
jgi:gamma-glutamyltranspeptidase/glutathione hydrolase